jgi:hypothetical protein
MAADGWFKNIVRTPPVLLLVLSSALMGFGAQTPPLALRPSDAESGTQFISRIKELSSESREAAVQEAVVAGNVPQFLRHFVPVTVTHSTNTATFFVAPDYLSVGSDTDYFMVPLTPATAQRIADPLDCSLPTPRMADAIHAAAGLRLAPSPIPPSPAMTTVPIFAEHNRLIAAQRTAALGVHPLGTLVAGDKKDLVVTARLASARGKVAIYGWHQTNGTPIQPLYLGHSASYADYSHGVRLICNEMIVNGTNSTVARVLADPSLAGLLSDEGVVRPNRYPTGNGSEPPIRFTAGTAFGEQIADFAFEPEVKIHLNIPSPETFRTDKPVLLVVYALPNGNTIPWTLGRTLRPGDDWHFAIQHVAAQTRFLRNVLTNRTLVLACLESGPKSWPAWRRKHGDVLIPAIMNRLREPFATNRLEIVLTGHSGGGSFTFGYLNQVEKNPSEVVRIAFLDSNYGYDPELGHKRKLTEWLVASDHNFLAVLAYDDANALLDGKPFVSASGGTWGRSAAMLKDLGNSFDFSSETNAVGVRTHRALGRRIDFFLKENPDRKILHTVQVERNGLIHALLAGTSQESVGYAYFGERAYDRWISED